jgi:hypothetical protein
MSDFNFIKRISADGAMGAYLNEAMTVYLRLLEKNLLDKGHCE